MEAPLIAELTAHQAFLRRLAGGLVRDAHQADDVVQQAWLTALAREPRLPGAARGWLAGIVRHTAQRLRRGERRRAAHERRAARAEAVESEASTAAQLEVQRRVSEALHGLAEPYRSTLFLRYFRDLGPAAIAAEQGVPVATVKSRLSRGLALLRRSLDARYGGDRRAWCTALLGVGALRRHAAREVLSLGVLAMTTKVGILVSGAGVAALLSLLLWPRGEAPPHDVPAPRIDTAAAPREAREAPAPRRAAPGERVAEAGAAAPLPVEAPAGGAEVRGRVLDGDGRPLAGVELWHEKRDPAAGSLVSDGNGAFVVPAPDEPISFGVRAPGWRTVWTGVFDPRRPGVAPIVVAVPGVRWAGRVRTAEGAPVPHATLRLDVHDALSARLGIPLDGGRENVWPIEADVEGRFSAEDAPAVPGATLRVSAGPSYVEAEVPAPPGPSERLEIVLEPRAADGAAVAGRVFDGDGAPVGGATVMLGGASARTDETGSFRLPTEGVRAGATLIAVAPGLQAAFVEDPAGPAARQPGWPAHLAVVLCGPTRTIRGHVLEAGGAPLANVSVWIDDPTPAGVVDGQASFVEPLAAGKRFADEAVTGDEGTFELTGLLDRPYRIGLFHGPTLRRVVREDVMAGSSDAVISLPPVETDRVVRGRVRSSAGVPVAGVQLAPSVTFRRLSHPASPPGAWTHTYSGLPAISDAEGAFTIAGARFDQLLVDGPHVMPQSCEVPEGADLSALEITVALRCHAQIVAEGELASADEAALLDRGGDALPLVLFSAGSTRSSTAIALHEGRSAVFTVSGGAAVLVLRRGGEELHRQDVALLPGETTRVRASR